MRIAPVNAVPTRLAEARDRVLEPAHLTVGHVTISGPAPASSTAELQAA
jgi:hypothetical protein